MNKINIQLYAYDVRKKFNGTLTTLKNTENLNFVDSIVSSLLFDERTTAI